MNVGQGTLSLTAMTFSTPFIVTYAYICFSVRCSNGYPSPSMQFSMLPYQLYKYNFRTSVRSLFPSHDTRGAFGGVNYSYYDGVGDMSGVDANAYSVHLGAKIIDGLRVDGLTEFKDFDESTVIANRLEIGLTPYTKVYEDFGIYGRLALGQNCVSGLGETDFGYGSVEPGVFYDFGQGTVNLGYRFRDSFEWIS